MRTEHGNYDGIDWNLNRETGVLTLGKEGETQILANDEDRDMNSWPWSGTTAWNIKSVETKGDLVMQGPLVGMFAGCFYAKHMDLSGFDTSHVTDMANMFQDCGSLKQLDVSGFNTSNVEDMQCMFLGCGDLTSLDVSRFDTSEVTNMSAMFEGCHHLKSLDVSGFDTSHVRDMSSMFESCLYLKSLNLSGLDMSNVGRMKNMFVACFADRGASVDISDLDERHRLSIYDQLENRKGLTIIDNKPQDDIGYMRKGNYDGMDWSFNKDTGVLTLGKENEVQTLAYAKGRNSSDWPWDDYRESIKSVETQGDLKLQGSLHRMFDYCSEVTSMNLSRFDTSRATDMSNMFSNCEKLCSLDVSGFDTSNVTDMSSMFGHDKSLVSLDMSGLDTSNVRTTCFMFKDCENLRSLDVSGFDTSNVEYMTCMFDGCNKMSSFDISGWDTSKVLDSGNMFPDSLSSLKISEGSKSHESFIKAVYKEHPDVVIVEDEPQKRSATKPRSRAQMAEDLFGHIQSNDLMGELEK